MRERTIRRRRAGTGAATRVRPAGGGKRPPSGEGDERVTLARALSKLGCTSRSQARTLVASGRVALDGRIVRNPDRWIDLRSSKLLLDGSVVRRRRDVTLAMNKPAGYITTRKDERSRATVYDLLGEMRDWVFPVGRLDRETTGLLLFTNDTALGEALTNPDSHVLKTYLVEVDRPLQESDVRRMEEGMALDDRTQLRPAAVARTPAGPTEFELTIHEGKNRQVRRMCEALGYRVRRLHRIRIGSLRLGLIAEGKTRILSREEVDALKAGARGGR